MSTISSAGIGSGLDVEGILSALMAIEARPKTQLAKARTELDAQVSSVGKLKSLTSAVRDAASRLSSPGLWDQTKAASANTDAVSVTSKDGAPPGALSVAVTAMAQGQTVASTPFADSTTVIGQGTLTIELGSWNAGATAFTAKSGASPVTVTLGPEDTTLEKIRDRINEADAGVSATLITDVSGTRLALRSRETGAENGFRVTASGAGLSALAYDPPAGGAQMARTQAASNAQATINGIAIESASNTLDGVVEGVTLQLRRLTTSNVEIAIENDPTAIRDQVDAFVRSFNELMAYIKAQTAYDPATKAAGALQGDSLATSLQRQFRQALNEPSSASSVYSRLADVGITMQANGSLAVDKTKLDAAIENRGELEKLFRADGTTTGEAGFIVRFRRLGDALLSSDGLFEARDSSLKARIERNTRNQADIDRRLEATEARLRARYQALDTNMGRLTGLQSYVSQQMTLLMKNSG